MERVPLRRLILWLSLTPRLGDKGIARVLDRMALRGLSAEEFLQLSEDKKRQWFELYPEASASLSRPLEELHKAYEAVEQRLIKLGVEWVTRQDASYPARLVQRHPDPPSLLYFYGNRTVLERSTFATLTSRTASSEALQATERIVEKGVLKPSVLVVGHDTAGYRRAAVVPLRWGSPRILVLNCGMFEALSEDLDREPFAAARLWRYRFDPQTDLVLSSHRPTDHRIGAHAKKRDWLISALADELIFVEVREGGVMQEIGLHALSRGAQVFVCEWPNYEAANLGNLRLLEAGAKPLRI